MNPDEFTFLPGRNVEMLGIVSFVLAALILNQISVKLHTSVYFSFNKRQAIKKNTTTNIKYIFLNFLNHMQEPPRKPEQSLKLVCCAFQVVLCVQSSVPNVKGKTNLTHSATLKKCAKYATA